MQKGSSPDYSSALSEMNRPFTVSDPWGISKYAKGKASYTEDPQAQADRVMAEGIRRDLLKSFGLDNTPQSDPWADLLLKESLRTTQPQLENALIGRGLGGSTVYKDAITDLFSKLGTQAALNSQSYKMNNLNALQNILTGMYGQGQNSLQNLLAQQGLGMNKAGILGNMANTQYQADQQSQNQLYSNLTNLALLGGLFGTMGSKNTSGTSGSAGSGFGASNLLAQMVFPKMTYGFGV